MREHVIAVLENFARTAAESQWSRCLPSLIDAAAHDPEARRLHSQISAEGRRSMVDLLAAGVANGDLPADLDPELMAEALAGPILLRRLMSLPPLEPGQVRELVDQLIPVGAGADGGTRRQARPPVAWRPYVEEDQEAQGAACGARRPTTASAPTPAAADPFVDGPRYASAHPA